jgi:hypothetical protein
MRQSWILLLSVGCLGTRDVVPRWVTDASDGSLEEEEEIAEAKCGEEDTGTEEVSGFAISGSIEDLATGEGPVDPSALCAFALDPTPVLSGGDPIVMAASEVCENGDYFVGGLSNPPSIGMFISIADCVDSAPTVMKSATGVDFDDVADLSDGDEHEGHTAYLVTLDYGTVINDNLIDYDGDAVTTGFMAGFVMDVNDDHVSGASLSCTGCADFYYLDDDDSDGMFQTDGARNTVTDASVRSVFVAPAAPIFTYKAGDDGTHTWDPQLFGSLPGYASFLLFNAIN